MLKNNIELKTSNNKYKFGLISFNLGIFFLPSALPISIFFLLISIYQSLNISHKLFFKEKQNQILFLCTGLMILSSINSAIFLKSITQQTFLDSLIGLLNWLPYFILFISSQVYLQNFNQRKTFSKFIIASTIPVILSCFLQAKLKIYGPFEIFNGLIIWFQRPVVENSGITGLFNNQNYTGIWLSAILPFLFYEFNYTKNNFLNKVILLIIICSTIYFTLLTNSRNALIGIAIVMINLLRKKYFLIFPFVFSFYFTVENFTNINLPDYLNLFNRFNPTNFFSKIIVLENGALKSTRLDIYSSTIEFIKESPILGWGPSSFAKVYQSKTEWLALFQHSHNMILEIAYNFGIPFAIIMVYFITKLIKDSAFKIFKDLPKDKSYFINKFWLLSVIVIVTSHLFDITYYDGKIAILIWVLLAGLKCIIDEKKAEDFYSS